MNENRIITKEDLIFLFKKLGIKKGSHVLVETSEETFSSIAGGSQTLIEALKECVGSQGCLIVPTFSYETLDPASDCFVKYPYELWEPIRESLNGFNLKLSSSSTAFGNQVLRNPKVIRTKHPVYSFAYLGKTEECYLKQSMNYPISFHHVLSAFKKRNAIVLCIDYPIEESCILQAFAQYFDQGLAVIERAYVKSGNENEPKTYLSNRVLYSFSNRIVRKLKKRSQKTNEYDFDSYEFETSLETMDAIFSKSKHSS